MKKLLALLLATLMVIGSMGMVTFAAEANTNVYNGNYSTKMVVTDSYQAVGSYFNVTADTDYVVTWMSKGSGSRLLKAQASVNYSWGAELGSGASKNGDTWQESSFEFNSGSNSLVVLVAACNSYGGHGTGYIDDVIVTKKADGSQVKKFDFEDGKPMGGKVSDYYDVEFSEVTMANGEATDGTVTPPSTEPEEPTEPETPTEPEEPETPSTPATGENPNVYRGHYSAAVTSRSTDKFSFFTSKGIKLEANTDYVVSAWTKGGSDSSVRILNSTSWSALKEVKGGSGGIWQQVTGEFNSGANTNVLFALTNNPYGGSSTRYYDNLMLYKKDDASKTNLVVDPGFELGTGWNFKEGDTIFAKEYSEIEIIDDEEYKYIPNEIDQPGGSSARKLYAGHQSVIFVPNGKVNTLSQDVTLEANKEYRASFWVRSPEGGKINFVMKDASGSAIFTYEVTGEDKWVRHLPVFTSKAAGTYSYCFESIADETKEVYVDYGMLYLKQRIEGTSLKKLTTDPSMENEGTWNGITGSYEDGDTGIVVHVSNDGKIGDVSGGIRVMCVGDSITEGVGATNMVGGYKKALYDMYEAEGVDINFVGPKSLGEPNFDAGSGQAGYPGWRVDQIRDNIENWMSLYKPQAILLMIGTNDVLQDKGDSTLAEDAIIRLEETIDKIIAKDPDVKLVVGSIPPLDNSGNNAKVQAYNAQIPALVAKKGANVSFVDIYSAFPNKSTGIGNDYTHPNDEGYGFIANKWFEGTKDLITSLEPSAILTDKSVVYDGEWSLKYNPWYVSYYTLLTYEMFTRGTIKIEADTDYELSMMVKGDQGVSLQTRIQGNWGGDTFATLNTNAGPFWSKASIKFNTGSRTELIIAMINSCMSTGTMYVDDIRLTKVSTGENLLTNSSMELDEDGSRPGWGNPNKPWSYVKADSAVTPPVATLTSIAVSGAKTEYEVGDEFVAPTVTATYSDGSKKTVAATFDGFDSATAGTKTITVKFEDQTTTYTVTVKDKVVVQPGEATLVEQLKYNFGMADKAVVEAKLADADNGNKKIKVGDNELYFNTDRKVYVGIIDVADVVDGSIKNVTILDEAPATFTYGNVNNDSKGAINAGDLLQLKLYMQSKADFDSVKLIASDVNGDGRVNTGDLLQLKLYMQNGQAFTALSK